MNRGAFTMVELVFIIVILGILGAIAVPKMAASRDDACITKLRGEVAALQSELRLHLSKEFLKGGARDTLDSSAIIEIKKALTSMNASGGCKWEDVSTTEEYVGATDATPRTYKATVGAQGSVDFKLKPTEFSCDAGNVLCQKLTGLGN